MLKALLRPLLRLLYRLELRGFERLQALRGERLLFISNHSSLLDSVLLYAFLPGKPIFIVHTEIAGRRLYRFFLRVAAAEYITLDPDNALGLKDLIRRLQEKRLVVLFPEGRITITGTVMKIYRGAVMLAEHTKALIVPIGIEGAQYSSFNYLPERRRLLPRIRMVMLEAVRLDPGAGIKANQLRLETLMNELRFGAFDHRRSLLDTLREMSLLHGRNKVLAEDPSGARLNYRELLVRSRLLAGVLRGPLREEQRVGLLLPSSCAALATFYALQWLSKTPAMLNFSVGSEGLLNSCRLAGLQSIITSRTFLEKADLGKHAARLGKQHRLLYLEDLRQDIPRLPALLRLLLSRLPGGLPRPPVRLPDAPAVILFTSGSEGQPKGVVISHSNLLACFGQVDTQLDFRTDDELFCCLPMFHSFGLFLGAVLGPLAGLRLFFYPSPLHYRVISELVYQRASTIFCSTNTFLQQYAQVAHPFDFRSLRYVVAGAEKLKENVRRAWQEKFGIRILEGYGVTESSPVISLNTPLAYRAGSVGRLLPGMQCYLKKTPGMERGGCLVVRGPNIMLGYLLPERPGEIVPPQDERGEGWYDTGDIVELDADGFIHILGRAKRFAKIAGEMISLGLVEELASECWPSARHAAVIQPDPRRGESVHLVSEQKAPQRKELQRWLQERGYSELHLPGKIWEVKELPLLGSGKPDYPAITRLAEELGRNAEAPAPRPHPETSQPGNAQPPGG